MSRTVNIIISTVMWCAIVAYAVASGMYARERRSAITIGELRISVHDPHSDLRTGMIEAEDVTRWLDGAGIDPTGRPIDEVDIRTIEAVVASHPEVKHVGARADLDGTLTVRVAPRIPIMRIRSAGGWRFWLTDDGYILPDRGDFSAYVPVVTGSIPFPFGTTASGSYTEMQRANYNDFLERFEAFDTERRTLASQLSETRSSLRAVRSSGPKRWWGRLRDSLFYVDKARRIAGLTAETSRMEAALADLEANRHALEEKEKKSYQSFRFLTKLANFVEFIGRSDFWSSQIVQINVPAVPSSGSWKEPLVELIPRAGDHVVLLGELDGSEREKLEKLRSFYLGGLWHEGWDRYRYIDLKYKDQIVCTN